MIKENLKVILSQNCLPLEKNLCSPSIPVNYLPESVPISSNPSSQVSVDIINSTHSSQTSHENGAV